MSKKILLIVEGESDEPRFFRRLFKCCYRKAEYKFYPHRTNLHVLAQELVKNYPDFENDNIDIRLVLASIESDEDRKQVLKETYSDIYLVFDFEPHEKNSHFEIIKRMLAFFNDSTLQGKLFINYPMMQSYKHFSNLPDHTFDTKTVSLDEVGNYKSIVARESGFTDLAKYDFRTFYSLAVHHLRKAYFIQTGKYELPSIEDYERIDYLNIFDKQIECATLPNGWIWVINTCIFVLLDFSPHRFYQFVSNHPDDLQI